MKTYQIVTDSTTDLPVSFIAESGLRIIPLHYLVDGEELVDSGDDEICHQFYERMRKGAAPTTSQINVEQYIDLWEELIASGIKEIVHICFSSALSGTANSAFAALGIMQEKHRDVQFYVVDSTCASLGEGLLVYHAVRLQEEGKSAKELVEWLEKSKLYLNHWFTVDDLTYLRRGGRVSPAAAFIGSLLDIKPMLECNVEGKLVPRYKVKGRKKAIKALFEEMVKNVENPDGQVIAISHADCIEDARTLESMIRAQFNISKAIINNVGAVIGSHSGPGTLALFFMGKERQV